MSKKQANTHAEDEYAKFAAQRRALLEAEGTKHKLNWLEAAARALPQSASKLATKKRP